MLGNLKCVTFMQLSILLYSLTVSDKILMEWFISYFSFQCTYFCGRDLFSEMQVAYLMASLKGATRDLSSLRLRGLVRVKGLLGGSWGSAS